MASEVFSARESNSSATNSVGRNAQTTRQRNLVSNASIPNEDGRTRIKLGGRDYVEFTVTKYNSTSGMINARLKQGSFEGSNGVPFGFQPLNGEKQTFEQALAESKKDILDYMRGGKYGYLTR